MRKLLEKRKCIVPRTVDVRLNRSIIEERITCARAACLRGLKFDPRQPLE
jgi:hypothetical protein